MKKINFKVITLFPEIIRSYLADALLAKAIAQEIINIEIVDLRKFSQNKYNSVDDTVFGGGDGMLIQYRPLAEAIKSLTENLKRKVIYLSPQGKTWDHSLAKIWSDEQEIVLICGRYAGIDQRIIHHYVDEEISLGDFVLSGGELPALAVIESIARFIPGVLGHAQSAGLDSFESHRLEAPQFSKPQIADGFSVPAVLLSGNHQKITEWKEMSAVLMTLKKRPDLLQDQNIDWQAVQTFFQHMPVEDKTVLGLQDLDFKI